MPNFQARERDVAQPGKPGDTVYQVPEGHLEYIGCDHRYVCTLIGTMTAADLLRPGAFDLQSLRPWDRISITFGPTPQAAHVMELMVLATHRSGLRRWEREAGLVVREHTVVGIVSAARQVTPHWGDEPPTAVDEAKVERTGKAA